MTKAEFEFAASIRANLCSWASRTSISKASPASNATVDSCRINEFFDFTGFLPMVAQVVLVRMTSPKGWPSGLLMCLECWKQT